MPFVYSNHQPGMSDAEREAKFWRERAQETTKRNLEKTKDMAPIPSMSDVYRANDQEHKEALAQKRAEIDASPYSVQSFVDRGQAGLALPRNDPYSKRLRWQQINPGTEYPGDDKVF